LVIIDEEMRSMIHSGAPEHDLDHHARTQTLSLRREASRRVLAGETSLEEVLRVTRED
jgi:general secretion pathway protein E